MTYGASDEFGSDEPIVPAAIVHDGTRGDDDADFKLNKAMRGPHDGGGGYGEHVSLAISSQRDGFMVATYEFMDEYRLTLQLIGLAVGIGILWVVANSCETCVLVLLIASMFFCLEYRLMNLVLWACIIVLWLHGWRLGSADQGLSLSWKR
jgi:hypothetical protein